MKKVITVVSDLHVGSSIGLCRGEGMRLADGGGYEPSRFQQELWRAWNLFLKFSGEIGGDKRILVINGDLVDGAHHNTVALATNNIEVQEAEAVAILKAAASAFDEVFVVRGTEAHTQPGAQSDERIAKAIGCEVDVLTGQFSRWQLWLDVDGVVMNIAHHIGTTSSAAYESSAVMREMVAALVEAGQWGQKLPDVIVRSHRHRFIEVSIPSARGRIRAVVTPSWQLRTPYVERLDRMRMPHIGGVVFSVEEKQCQVYEKIYPMKNAKVLKV